LSKTWPGPPNEIGRGTHAGAGPGDSPRAKGEPGDSPKAKGEPGSGTPADGEVVAAEVMECYGADTQDPKGVNEGEDMRVTAGFGRNSFKETMPWGVAEGAVGDVVLETKIQEAEGGSGGSGPREASEGSGAVVVDPGERGVHPGAMRASATKEAENGGARASRKSGGRGEARNVVKERLEAGDITE
ncbi:unnamed protein product, partial [Discosporangium mesarthrocarpum]